MRIFKKKLFRVLSIVLSVILVVGLLPPFSVSVTKAEEQCEMNFKKLTVENRINPLGIDVKDPDFSWILSSNQKASVQTAYRIVVAKSEADLSAEEYVWDTGKIISSNSVDIKYTGSELLSQQRYYWKVCVWDGSNRQSEWSEVSWFETALFAESDWSGAQWISGNTVIASEDSDISLDSAYWIWHAADGNYWTSMPAATRYFRKTITIESVSAVDVAILAATADDTYELYINGVKAAETPTGGSWKTAQFANIKELLVSGNNVIAIKATNNLGSGGVQTGGGMLAAIKLTTDGVSQYITTDSSWVTNDAEIAGWETISFDDSDWTAANATQKYGSSPWYKNVTVDLPDGGASSVNPAPLLRNEITLSKEVSNARAYVCGLGYFVMTIDGKRVGNSVLDPGTSNYHKTSFYVVHDVTDVLSKGSHALGITLGRGFYSLPAEDTIYWNDVKWLSEPKLKLKLQVEYTDGTSEVFVSNSAWKTSSSPILRDSLYMGETYDARLEQPGWDTVGFDASQWSAVSIVDAPAGKLKVQTIEPIRVTDTLEAVEATDLGNGVYVLKYPVVTAGWAKMTVKGDAGTTVTLTYGEKLRTNGTVNNDGSSGLTTGPIQIDRYTLKGGDTETYEPQFSYKGFQYIQVEGYPGTIDEAKTNIKAQVVHSDLKETGNFESGNELLNKIHEITKRTMVNNSHSIISDTPMYEKRGWTGDANVMAKSIVNNYDMNEYLSNWLISISDNHSSSGGGTEISPNKNDGWTSNVIWGGAMIGLPYELYKNYGNVDILKTYYTNMMNEMRYYKNNRYESDTGLIKDGTYGDWVSPKGGETATGPHKQPEDGRLLYTAYVYKYALIMEEVATLLGKTADATEMRNFANGLKSSLNSAFLNTEKGIYETANGESYRQTSNAVPLMFGMVPDEYEAIVAKNLAENIKSGDFDLNCGFAGLKELFPVLCEYGYTDVAYTLATQTDYPSHGFWIENGATTLWEMWELTARSLDHNLHGSIDDWFYSYLGGITAKTAGYKEISIKPYVPGELDYVNSSIETSYGTVISNWSKDSEGLLTMNVTIPTNTTAVISVPARNNANVNISGAEDATYINAADGYVNYSVGSGNYVFKTLEEKINVNFANVNSYSYYDGTTTVMPFSEKVKHLTAVSDYDNTTLDVSGLTIDYMKNKLSPEDNLIKNWKITGYTGVETTQINTADYLNALTDMDFYAAGGASGTTRSNGTMATKDHNNSCWILNEKSYESTTTSEILYGKDRIKAGYYDATVTLELQGESTIDSFYLFSQWSPEYTIGTYAVYVADTAEELFNEKNRVCLFDYYEGYQKDLTVTGENKPYKLTCRGRHSEGQLWTFDGDVKPSGSYVGIKVYDAALSDTYKGYLSIYDIGVFGHIQSNVADYFSTEVTSTSKKTVVNAGQFPIEIKNAEGEKVELLNGGESYTAQVVGVDSRYVFEGWFKNGATEPVSTDHVLNINGYAGESYVAKFTTNVIFSINPYISNLNFELTWPNANNNKQAVSYSSSEDALKVKVGKNEYGGSFGTVSVDGKNMLDTEFEPWTTYKVSLTTKLVANGANQISGVSVASIPSIITYDTATSFGSTPTGNEYVTYNFYFNSGAADYDRADALDNVRSSKVGSQFINLNGVNTWSDSVYADVYIKDFSIEKVDNVYVTAPNATVTLDSSNNFKWATGSYNSGITADTNAYGGYGVVGGALDKSLTAVNNWMKSDLNSNGIVGAADDEINFSVVADEDYKVDSVTVNGKICTANESGVYSVSYNSIDVDDSNKYGNSDAVNIAVETSSTAKYYNVNFVDASNTVIGTILVKEGTVPDLNKIAEISNLVEDIYGYTPLKNQDGTQVWSDDIYSMEIYSDITVEAIYQSEDISTEVVVYDVDGTTKLIDKTMRFDTAIYLKSNQDANSWKIGDSVVISGSTGKLYACGEKMVIYASVDNISADNVAIVGNVLENNEFTVFAHSNVIDPKEFGVIFFNGTFNDKGNITVEAALSDPECAVVAKIDLTELTVFDFMCTLKGIKSGVTRYAVAFAKFGDEYVYSDTICVTNLS